MTEPKLSTASTPSTPASLEPRTEMATRTGSGASYCSPASSTPRRWAPRRYAVPSPWPSRTGSRPKHNGASAPCSPYRDFSAWTTYVEGTSALRGPHAFPQSSRGRVNLMSRLPGTISASQDVYGSAAADGGCAPEGPSIDFIGDSGRTPRARRIAHHPAVAPGRAVTTHRPWIPRAEDAGRITLPISGPRSQRD